MWNGMDRAAVEAILGKDVVWREEDVYDVMGLMGKAICETLTAEEQAKLDALMALYESGRQKDEKKGMKKTPVPRCHGEPMEPIYRYIEKGVTYRVWRCNYCLKTSTVPIYGGKK